MDNNHNDQKVTKKKQRKKKKREKKDSRNMVVESFVDHQTSCIKSQAQPRISHRDPVRSTISRRMQPRENSGNSIRWTREKGRESARKLEICHR